MKIMIVIHSESGNTALLARATATRLREHGHDVDIELLRTSGKVAPRARSITLKRIPEINDCDILIVGGPVWAFTSSPVIAAYIDQLSDLHGKKAFSFVTKGLPFEWTGGISATGKLNRRLSAHGAEVIGSEIFIWGFHASEERIRQGAERICGKVLS